MKLRSIMFVVLVLTAAGCENLCTKTDCSQQGYCHEGDCICDKWLSGESCEIAYNAEYQATYSGLVTKLSRAVQTVKLTINADENIPNRMNVKELGVYFEFESDTELSIPRQFYSADDEDGFIIEGTGSYSTQALYIEWWNIKEPEQADFIFTGKRESNRVNN